MRSKVPDRKNALSIIESAKKTMDFTLTLSPTEAAGVTITRNIYECFRSLGDALLVHKGIFSEDHILPIQEVSALRIDSERPISLVENLRRLRHNINYYGYTPKINELNDALSLARACFYKAYDKIKEEINKE